MSRNKEGNSKLSNIIVENNELFAHNKIKTTFVNTPLSIEFSHINLLSNKTN